MEKSEITVPDMPYMREIFKILRTGAFISEDCLSDSNRRYYRVIDNHFEAYFKYFLQLGFYLEKGYGYIHLCEARPAGNIQSKLRTDVGKYIEMIAVLMKFRPELAPGAQFKSYELQMFCDQDDEMRSVLPESDNGQLSSRITRFLENVAKEGFIDLSVDETTCYVTSAFRYLKEYVLRIRLYGEHAKFNLEKEMAPEAETPAVEQSIAMEE